jgi:methylated-DNA-[protein]-cysteine S-methyltransferase
MDLACKTVASPVGPLTLVASDQGLVAVLLPGDSPDRVRLAPLREEPSHPILLAAERQLGEYFAGARTEFCLLLDPRGTPFQRQVWKALEAIPYGETTHYGALAALLGNPQATRAVGAANGRNPLPIVVPCHRVIGASGKLTGFAGGLPMKAFLLHLEQQHKPFALEALSVA